MFCKYCGKEIDSGREMCDECAGNGAKSEVLFEGEEVVKETQSFGKVSFNNDFNSNDSNYNSNYNTSSTNGNYNNTNVNANNYTNTTNYNNSINRNPNAKSKVAAGLFGIFLGAFGVHNFYLGYTGKAVAQLLISLLTCLIFSPVSAIWGLIEGILILSGNISKDANGNDLLE